MKAKDITPETFAQWSLERDWKVGIAEVKDLQFLSEEEREAYLAEARYYINNVDIEGELGWPVDILERLED